MAVFTIKSSAELSPMPGCHQCSANFWRAAARSCSAALALAVVSQLSETLVFVP
jgi:hypothetical protein